MNDKSTVVRAGVGFTDLLTLVFIVLKLCNVINWSWWWVLSPLWISFSLFIIYVLVVVIAIFAPTIADSISRKVRGRRHD